MPLEIWKEKHRLSGGQKSARQVLTYCTLKRDRNRADSVVIDYALSVVIDVCEQLFFKA